MHARSVILLAAALAAAGPLAGCIQGAADGDDPSRASASASTGPFTPVDGLTAIETATPEAEAWNADADLYVAFATEGFPVDLEDPPFVFDSSPDAVVGDGLAGTWTLLYGADDADAFFAVAVHGADGVLYARELTVPPWGSHVGAYHAQFPVEGGDAVTSADAAAAFAANATARAWLEDHPVSAVRLGLVHDDEGTAWKVTRFTTGGYSVTARVDAASGAVTDVHRFPDDLLLEPCPRTADCEPQPPEPPEEPVKPEPRVIEKTVTLTTFDPRAEMIIPFDEAPLWLVNVTVTADVPGVDELEARTVKLYDLSGWVVDDATGTGTLTVAGEELRPDWWGGEYRVEVGTDGAVARDQDVTLKAVVEYGAFIGHQSDRWSDMMWGHVGLKQSEDHAIEVPGDTTVTLRLKLDEAGRPPFHQFTEPDVTFTLHAPDGTARDVQPGEETIVSDTGDAGWYTLTATGGDANVFGASYQLLVTYERIWEEPTPARAEAVESTP